MRGLSAVWIAAAAGAEVVCAGTAGDHGPQRATVDSRALEPGDLFVGLPGARVDGGRFAADALARGAWGVLVAPEHAAASSCAPSSGGAVLAAADPLAALHRLARAWRRELGCAVIAVTGSTGKTSTKDILAALLVPHRRTVSSRANFNTEVGMPLELLAAPAGTEVAVLELAMRGPGQIAQLTAICEPDVGVIVNVGPVHLELLGSLEAVAAAKAELLAGLAPGAAAVVPAGEALLAPYLRDELRVTTFGPGGDVTLGADGERLEVDAAGERIELVTSLAAPYQRLNLLAAVAAARALGVVPGGRLDVALSAWRGQRHELPDGVVLIDDCYNANPMSVRAALDDLAAAAAARPPGRRVAVLGDMLELGPGERAFHAEAGARAAQVGVDLLLTVGPLAAAMADAFDGEAHAVADAGEAAALLADLVRPGDTILVKGSRGVGLEVVGPALAGREAIA